MTFLFTAHNDIFVIVNYSVLTSHGVTHVAGPMSSPTLAARRSAIGESAWKLVVTFLRQQPRSRCEYHIVQMDEVFAGALHYREEFGVVIAKACSIVMHVVKSEEGDQSSMPLFHPVGRSDNAPKYAG